jgi:hypothetical protein
MKLPNKEKAYIPSPKIHDYLLSKTHSIGMWKSSFFRSIGFDETNAESLEKAIVEIAQNEDVKKIIESPYGTKYVVDGFIVLAEGISIGLQTVWIIESGEEYPRFVTAYPL